MPDHFTHCLGNVVQSVDKQEYVHLIFRVPGQTLYFSFAFI